MKKQLANWPAHPRLIIPHSLKARNHRIYNMWRSRITDGWHCRYCLLQSKRRTLVQYVLGSRPDRWIWMRSNCYGYGGFNHDFSNNQSGRYGTVGLWIWLLRPWKQFLFIYKKPLLRIRTRNKRARNHTADELHLELGIGKLFAALMGEKYFTSSGHFILLHSLTLEGNVLVAGPNKL